MSGWRGVRDRLKAALERTATGFGAARLGRRLQRGRTLILAYHNVVPLGERAAGERTLHLEQKRFGAQLDLLGETVSVIPLAAVNDSNESERRPRVILTWDDAYNGTLTAGVEEVTRRGLPATICVPPGCLGGPPFWWDALAESSGGEIPAPARSEALTRYGGETTAVLRAFQLDARELPEHARPATLAGLEAAWQRPGISVASHGWSHRNLIATSARLIDEELVRSLGWLRERRPGSLSWFSYPYGLHNADVRQRAAAAGYSGALQVSGGWLPTSRVDRYALPRLNVPAALSLEGFALRLGGLLCG